MNETTDKLDLAKVREKLAGKSGQAYWRSLEEVAETPEFQAWVDDEFPNRSSLMQVDRRSLLKYMGASMMLAGLSGCRSLVLPSAKLVPYVNRPEELVDGQELHFATGYTLNGITTGVIVESHYGRPTKIEGNPAHPFSGGATDSFMQASVLNLYDPDRTKSVMQKGLATGWDSFLKIARDKLSELQKTGGKGFAVMMESTSSPTLIAEVEKLKKAMPEAIIASWEPACRDQVYNGATVAFGKPVETIYNLETARVILSLDADFLGSMPGFVKYGRDWAKGRNVDGDPSKMSRLYALECTPTGTGAVADHRAPVSMVELENFVRQLAAKVGAGSPDAAPLSGELAKWLDAIAADLQANAGRAVVIPGEFVSANVHSLCHAINGKIGAAGTTVRYCAPSVYMSGMQTESAASLINAAKEGHVQFLLVLGGNPVFNAPADWKIADALKKIEITAHLAPHFDETSKVCDWHLPESHELESWGDGRALDGTVTISQPLIDPLYDTKSAWEVLRAIQSSVESAMPSYDALQARYKAQGMTEAQWRSALNEGMVPNSKAPAMAVAARDVADLVRSAPSASTELEILLRPDPTIFDGRFANNGWLQELPKPITTITWDNTIQVSPKLAESMGLVSGDEAEVETPQGKVKGAIWVLPGQPERTITVHFGYGRDMKETLVADGAGFNAYVLQSGSSPFFASGSVNKTGGKRAIASTQMHHYLEGRDIIREETLDHFLHGGHEHKSHHKDISMYPDPKDEFPYDGPQWGMTIDLNVCTGCHVCVTACQAENNIPVVGKDQVIKGREMHWIRIDRYYGSKDLGELGGKKPVRSDLDNPTTHFMPLACMHCEKAPCEPVCPVAATVHSHEGLNQMVYNRCVGTRYCSNNCPYKVRRFNFLNYNDRKFTDFNLLNGEKSSRDLRVRLMVNNPEVTVRGRGVMEKCTYCVQRINHARIHAKNEAAKGRREKPDPIEGEITTACQQACPTGAIVFGNVADPSSKVSRLKAMKRNYSLIEELNTKNRTTYLTKLRNPNKELENA